MPATRREFLVRSAAAAAAVGLGQTRTAPSSTESDASTREGKRLRILIMGGTGGVGAL